MVEQQTEILRPETLIQEFKNFMRSCYRPENFLPGLKLGAGMRYVGETFDGSRTVEAFGQTLHTAVTTDTYTVFDLMVGYEFNNFDISLNIDNVADKTVVTSCLYRGDCFYGQQRTVTANVKYRF